MSFRSFLFAIIFIEGYAVLGTELIIIRQLVPFVGSGTETIAMVIAAVLLPLAIGYFSGGRYYKAQFAKGKNPSIRKKLLQNIVITTFFLAFGLPYILLEVYFLMFDQIGITHRVVQTAIYCIVFVVYPIYLLGQTIPLVSNYFTSTQLSDITGKILFFSTTGSFCGSVFTTLILMSFIGVHHTIVITMSLLLFLVILISRSLINTNVILVLGLVGFSAVLNSNFVMNSFGAVLNNNYHIVSVFEQDDGTKNMSVNRNNSSKLSEDRENMFLYWKYIENNIIKYLAETPEKEKILVIGAAGFTIGMDDLQNEYTFVDIDPDLQEIAEEKFLGRPLNDNQKFVAEPARAFLNSNKEKYDLIVMDAFTSTNSVPYQLVTVEFFQKIKEKLKDNGVFAVNKTAYATFTDVYSTKYDETFRTVFPYYNRIPLAPINPYEIETFSNVMYVYYNLGTSEHRPGKYTDDKNGWFWDRDRGVK